MLGHARCLHGPIVHDLHARVVQVFGSAQAHQACLFADARTTRINPRDQLVLPCDRTINFETTAIERITYEPARLKAWKFAALTQAMNTKQRQLFKESSAADVSHLHPQLGAL